MMRRLILLFILWSVSWTARADRPNVVFILADDLGWSDTTLYGTTQFYRTPNIQRLAKRGMTFTRAYSSSPLCSPTRASILTGLSPARHGITSPSCHLPQVVLEASPSKTGSPISKVTIPNSVTRLKTDYYTLAEAFKDAGYVTGHFGKWHLGAEPYSPLEHGFDVDIPHHAGPGPAGSYVAPWKFKDFDHDPNIPNQHIEDRMAQEAVAFIEKHGGGTPATQTAGPKRTRKPFFLNYWMFSVHAPFDAKKTLIEKYRKTVDPKNPQRCPTYAAMIESMDDAVGALLDALDRLKLSDNTIIVFASDNGGNMYNEVDGETPTSNAPLRGGKATMYEGGIRGPCSVIWPGKIAAGSQSREIIQSSDFFPTLLEMTNIKKSRTIAFDGISIVPALRGSRLHREAIFTYFPHNPAVPDWLPPSVSVHRGDWKLIRIFHGGEGGQHRWKLFNLREDIGEKRNLVAEHPALVKELDQLIEQHLIETKAVRPGLNPRFDPKQYQPELEGVPFRRKPTKKNQTLAKKVAGWRPHKDCELTVRGGKLVIKSTGNDPYLSLQLPKRLPAGQYAAKMRFASSARGNAQLFWSERGVSPAFFRDRSKSFQVTADGKPHEYVVNFETDRELTAIRFDPARGKGIVQVSSITVLDHRGSPVHECKFQ